MPFAAGGYATMGGLPAVREYCVFFRQIAVFVV